jgi:diphthamide biosynthesis methyltransferase
LPNASSTDAGWSVGDFARCVAQGADKILDGADVEDVAFLVVGDPFG